MFTVTKTTQGAYTAYVLADTGAGTTATVVPLWANIILVMIISAVYVLYTELRKQNCLPLKDWI